MCATLPYMILSSSGLQLTDEDARILMRGMSVEQAQASIARDASDYSVMRSTLAADAYFAFADKFNYEDDPGERFHDPRR